MRATARLQGLTLATHNIRGLSALGKRQEIEPWMREKNIELLVAQESKVNATQKEQRGECLWRAPLHGGGPPEGRGSSSAARGRVQSEPRARSTSNGASAEDAGFTRHVGLGGPAPPATPRRAGTTAAGGRCGRRVGGGGRAPGECEPARRRRAPPPEWWRVGGRRTKQRRRCAITRTDSCNFWWNMAWWRPTRRRPGRRSGR